MPLTFRELSRELVGHIPGLPTPAARRLVQRAWKDVLDERQWSFLTGEAEIIIPALVNTGTVSVTQLSATIVFDATAKVAIDALVLANPALITRQFRVSSGPLYSIISYDSGTGTATLDRLYGELTNATATYQVYKAYYSPPTTDFLRFKSVLNPLTGFTIYDPYLHKPREWLDQRDPLRGAQGTPYYLVDYIRDSNDQLRFELWPHPTTALVLIANFIKRGQTFSLPTDLLPLNFDDGLVMERALFRAYEWAEANKGHIPELRGTDWRFLRAESNREYGRLLGKAKKQDNEVYQSTLIRYRDRRRWFYGPVDSNWAQSHDVPAFG